MPQIANTTKGPLEFNNEREFQMATAAIAAKHIFIGTSRFRDLVGTGVITKQKTGAYKLDTVREEYCLHMQKIAAGRSGDDGAVLSKQRARLATAQAQTAERKNEIASGAYVTTVSVQYELGLIFGVMREIALSVPGKIGDSLQPYTPLDREKIYEIVKREIYEMLTNLASPEVVTAALEGKKK
jgi:phage terminase Nu1 subunit (DNA packaging protein)